MPRFVDVSLATDGPVTIQWENESLLVEVQSAGGDWAALTWAKDGDGNLTDCLASVSGDLGKVVEAFQAMVAKHATTTPE